jgi:hypothetical protein
MDGDLKQKILAYADKAYSAAYHQSLRQTSIQVSNAREALASRGHISSSVVVQEVARIEAEHINKLVQAKANALLDGYELFGAEIDNFIEIEANELRWALIKAISRDPNLLPNRVPDRDNFERLLIANTDGVVEIAICEIEQRKVIPKLRKPLPPVQNVYHLHGNNSRVNIDTTDQSVNVVNVTNEELFVHLRQLLSEKTSKRDQDRVLEKLDALENAQNSPTFAQRYTEFIAAAADYVTLLTPFMPALAEMVRKAVSG